MAFTYGTEIQDRVAYAVLNQQYSALQAWQKAALDNTTTTPTGGAAKTVLIEAQQLYQWLNLAGASVLPDAAEQYFVARLYFEFAKALGKDEAVKRFAPGVSNAWEVAISTFSRFGISDAETDGTTLTRQTIRYYVANWLARRSPIRMVPMDDIDTAAQWVIDTIWTRTFWTFRRIPATFAIAVGGAVVVTNTSTSATITPDAFTVRDLYVSGGSLGFRGRIKYVGADEMSQYIATIGVTTSTGQPRVFRFNRTAAGVLSWQFFPAPDTSYTAYGEVVLSGPGIPSSVSDSTPFAKFPAEFIPIIKDMVRAKIAVGIGAPEAPRMWEAATDAMEILLPTYDNIGDLTAGSSVVDYYKDVEQQRGIPALGGGGSL